MKKIAILIASFALVWGARSQATDPRIVGIAKMAARTAIIPFGSDAEAKSGTSSYLINVSDWEWTESEEEVTFTATFKRPTDWHSRSVIVRIAQATSSFALDVNGERVGYSQWGGGRAEFDVTGFVKEFYNTLTITIFRNSVANRLEEPQIVPDEGFGSVEVVSQPMVRVEDIIVDARVDNKRGEFGRRASHIVRGPHSRKGKIDFLFVYSMLLTGFDAPRLKKLYHVGPRLLKTTLKVI